MIQAGWGQGGYHPVIEAFMRSAGATFWDKDKKHIVFENSQLDALKFMTDAILKDKTYVPEFGSRWTGFRQIKEAMVFGHGAMIGSFKVGSDPNLIFKTAPMPKDPVTGKRITTLTSWALVIMSDAENAKACAKWLAYITSEDKQKIWLKETGELPSYLSVVNDPEFQNDPLLKPVLDSLDYAVPTFSMGWADPASKLNDIAFKQIINNGENPEDALKEAITEINKYLDETFSQF